MIELTFQPFQQSKVWVDLNNGSLGRVVYLINYAFWGKKPYIQVLVPKEYQESYDYAKAWMPTSEFAVWKNDVFSKLGKFDATLRQAEEFLDALYKVYNRVGLDLITQKMEGRAE